MAPLVHPTAAGVKLTFTSTLCPAVNVRGRLMDEVVKSRLLTAKLESVTLVSPVFVTVTSKTSLWPLSTVPNFRLDGEHVSCCADAPALFGRSPISRSTAPRVRKWTERTESD
jgi:hypothetical protein